MRRIRWKIIVLMLLLIGGICSVFSFQVVRNGNRAISDTIAAKEENARLLTETVMQQISKQYSGRIKGFVQQGNLQGKADMVLAFAARDRKKLYRFSRPYLTLLREENPYFSSLSWVLPDNHTFLRVGKPGFWGDDVSAFRPDAVDVNLHHKQVAGFALDPYGMHFRVVEPVFDNEQYVGSVQFGIKASLFVDILRKRLGVPAALVLPIAECIKAKFLFAETSVYKNYTLISQDSLLFYENREMLDFSKSRQQVVLGVKDSVLLNTLDLMDSRGHNLGSVIIAVDISEELAEKRTLLVSSIIISLFILLISYLVLSSGIAGFLGRISALNKSLEASKANLEEKVKERTRSLVDENQRRRLSEQQLVIARDAAESANNAKTAFLSNMSHELRTPLNAVMGYAQIIDGDTNLTVQQQKGIGIIHQSGEHLLTLISDILDLSKIEAGKMELLQCEFKCFNFFRNIESIIKVKSDAKGIAFHSVIEGQLPDMIVADELRLRQVLLNLLSNAVKFTDVGYCLLTVHFDDAVDDLIALTLSVEDSGLGIALEMQEKIFEPFQQVGEKVKYAEGTGLGLSISRQIVRLMDAELCIESPVLVPFDSNSGGGQGSLFSFTIMVPVASMN